MRRWAGVGIGALAAAAAALASVHGGVRADDDVDAPRRVEIVRFGSGGARLGVALEDVRADDVARLKLAEERGAVVKEVVKGSAAEKAGLKEDDVILSYQGERVGSAAQLRRLVRETPGGRRVTMEASRAGAAQRLTATLAKADDHELALGDDNFRFDMPDSFHFNVPVPPIPPVPPVPPMDHMFGDGDRGQRFFFRDRDGLLGARPGRLGLTYQQLSGQLARYFKVEDGALLVTEVETDGPAAKAGLRAGDVIVKFNGKAVSDGDGLRHSLYEVPSGTDVTLTVQRDGHPLDLQVSPRGEKRAPAPRSTT